VIPVHKSSAPPHLLLAGKEHATELCAAYDADPDLCRTGIKKWNFREDIYRSARAELDACHYGKCCYCEAPLDANSEVEHWRPKSRYYWLAYVWENLFLICGFCNKKKGEAFPIEDEAKRATHHGMSIADERPGILKPDGDEDPSHHIRFHDDRPEPLTPLGLKTIEVLGLDSPKHRGRLRHLAEIRAACALYRLNAESADPEKRVCAESARIFVETAVRPDKPYSATISAYLKANPLSEPAPAAINHAGGPAIDG
jgi:uncharacterized protein (TIGR02646 family)